MKKTLEEIVKGWEFDSIIVHVVKPVRKDAIYTKGRIVGFKLAIWGGAHTIHKHGSEYDSRKWRKVREAKIHVQYDIADYGGSAHSDWIPESCLEFEIRETSTK